MEMTHFELELEKLKNRIIKMSNLVYNQVENSFNILLTGDLEMIKVVEDNEMLIDKIDVKVDKLCQRIFALAQPVASDLRFIIASLKVDSDLERIGDIAMSIVGRTESAREEPSIITKLKIDELANKSKDLFRKAIECYKTQDLILASEVMTSKDSIKDLCDEVINNIILEMTNKSEVIVVATNLIIILRQIERLLDHSENIVENVVFWVDGKIIKHTKV